MNVKIYLVVIVVVKSIIRFYSSIQKQTRCQHRFNTLCFVLWNWICSDLLFAGVSASFVGVCSVYLNIDTRAEETQIEWQDRSRAIWAPQVRLPFSESERKGWLSIGTENGANMMPETLENMCTLDYCVTHDWFQSTKSTDLTLLVGVSVGLCVVRL